MAESRDYLLMNYTDIFRRIAGNDHGNVGVLPTSLTLDRASVAYSSLHRTAEAMLRRLVVLGDDLSPQDGEEIAMRIKSVKEAARKCEEALSLRETHQSLVMMHSKLGTIEDIVKDYCPG